MYFYLINLPHSADAEKFAGFMRDEYFPAIHKGATRIGKIESMALLQGEVKDHEFVWQVDWGGLPLLGRPLVDDQDAVRKFEAFKPVVRELGAFKEAATWPNPIT